MGWKGVTVMDQRISFISEYLDGYFPVNELCLQFSINRKTAYKWIKRYEKKGAKGLEDRSHRPHYCPHETNGDIMKAISLRQTKSQFTKLFREYGLPQRIRTDNGVLFASSAIARLSALSVWWIKPEIYPEQIELCKPQQNGKHERMHLTLKKEATILPEKNLAEQQKRFNLFRKEYNTERPHEAIDMKTPSSIYLPSEREMPKRLKHYDYPLNFEVRRVSRNS